ncbi:patatin-like phospholipase family protein [Gymnodinialimonas sp. 2305UL16-5]
MPPPDASTYENYLPVGMPADVRFFGDNTDLEATQIANELRGAVAAHHGTGGVNFLALSGGGANGAFGAGILSGWSATGARPEFDIVTGISTGAIIAPFAFLGSGYDAALQRFYTQTRTRDVARFRVLGTVFAGQSLANNRPLQAAIRRELTDQMLTRIAEEHATGRRLIIGTTYVDAERPVLWDVGAIASVGTPDAYELARQVILASASIPLVFEPVQIDVTNGQDIRSEMHIDGAVSQHIFAYPQDLQMGDIIRQLGLERRRNTIWIIQNDRLEPRFEPQSERFGPLLNWTYDALMRSQGLGDVAHIASLAQRDGLALRGVAIPATFAEEPTQFFDPTYMSNLFQVGYEMGLDQGAWRDDIEEVLLGQ